MRVMPSVTDTIEPDVGDALVTGFKFSIRC